MRPLLASIVCVWLCTASPAQTPQLSTLTDDALSVRGQADEEGGNCADGLPVFEELVRRHPDIGTNQEGLAVCLAQTASSNPNSQAGAAQWQRAKDALARAIKAGDHSEMLGLAQQVLSNPYVPHEEAAAGSAEAKFATAEKLFASGDIQGALDAYQAAFTQDPQMYEAALYAGDMLARLHREKESYTWFARAVQVNPARETAYRYWADALDQAGDADGARAKAVTAFVVEPTTSSLSRVLSAGRPGTATSSCRKPTLFLPRRQQQTGDSRTQT